MAVPIYFKSGGYNIARGETKSFTFWWPDSDSSGYFDVWIAVEKGVDQDGDVVPDTQSLSLREVSKEMVREFDEKSKKVLYILKLTILNEESFFDVTFTANHIRIY